MQAFGAFGDASTVLASSADILAAIEQCQLQNFMCQVPNLLCQPVSSLEYLQLMDQD